MFPRLVKTDFFEGEAALYKEKYLSVSKTVESNEVSLYEILNQLDEKLQILGVDWLSWIRKINSGKTVGRIKRDSVFLYRFYEFEC